jgi:DNA modification methylase
MLPVVCCRRLAASGWLSREASAKTFQAKNRPPPISGVGGGISNHTRTGGAIYDPFVGSGTALIAAHKLGRVAYAMDLDPQYVQVTVTRWETYAHQRARRLSRATGVRRSS